MSEAIISRRGYNSEGKPELRTETITGNTNWTVPNYKKESIYVLIFGGGGGNTSASYKGGSGWMNNGEFNNLTPGTNIRITIGDSSTNLSSAIGGTTSFGTYLSANGGSSRDGGAGGQCGDGYQFGGGGGYRNNAAGNGGIWGGGGGGGNKGGNIYVSKTTRAGDGGLYGGGGGGSGCSQGRADHYMNGGNGGEYGGGGGGGYGIYDAWREGDYYRKFGYGGNGGTYGGNGARFNQSAEDGTNTMSNESVPSNLRGPGSSGRNRSGATQGFYMYINARSYNSSFWYNESINTEGGGGFGGSGGFIYQENAVATLNQNDMNNRAFAISGAGGGGYGGNGGNSYYAFTYEDKVIGGAGGGGYGGKGQDSKNIGNGGGGGGYFSDGDGGGGGGYYNYAHGGGSWTSGKYGYGSGASSSGTSMPGVCIIQYWI